MKMTILIRTDRSVTALNAFKENRRSEPRKVDKSNGIEIQINAALNDAYRISRDREKGENSKGKIL